MNKLFLMCLVLTATLCLRGAQVSFDSAAQAGVLSAAVKQYYGAEGSFDLTPVNPLPTLLETPTSVELLQLPETPSSTMAIRVRYLKGDEKLGEISASFRAVWRVNMFVARRPMQKFSALNASDFEVQALDRLALRQVPVETSAKLSEYELANSLSAGAPLTWNALKPQPLVRKGALVDVVAEEGSLKVTTRAIALNDGGRGELISMRNASTNRSFEAYVINENLVKVSF